MAVWDTSLASRLHPEEPLFETARHASESGAPILVAAPTVAEISFGLQLRAADERFAAALGWFTDVIAAGVLGVLPLTREAALLAGRLRALHPAAPSVAPGDTRPKPERRVAWIADIQIAAIAWVNGRPLCTADRGHFELLASAIASLFPAEGELEILAAPEPH